MKHILFAFLLLPVLLVAQYPTTGNKARLGYQTTGDGLIWRGVAADTSYKPIGLNMPYFQLDTVNGVLRRYIKTKGRWQTVGGGGTTIDSLVYSTIKGLNDSIQAEKQTLSFASPLLGISDGNNVNLSGLLTGYVTGSGTNNRIPKWSAATNLTDSEIQDNGTAVSILSSKPFMLGQWTTAGRPTGTSGYMGYNTTLGGNEWYDGARWNSVPKADRSTFTSTYIPVTNSSGQLTESSNLKYNLTRKILYIGLNNLVGEQLYSSTATGEYNNFFGYNIGQSATTASYNNVFGYEAGQRLTTGRDNNFFGTFSGRENTTGGNNNFFGYFAGFLNTTGNANNFFGTNSGRNNTTGSSNNFFGAGAGTQNTSGSNNNFCGTFSGRENTTGGNNNFFGSLAGANNTAGEYNNFFGGSSGQFNTTGIRNTFIGTNAGNGNTTGGYNLFMSESAGFLNTVGGNNIGLGRNAGRTFRRGNDNIAIGTNSIFGTNGTTDTLTGSRNIAVGSSLREIRGAASDNIIIGNSINLPTPSGNNQLNIGNLIFATSMTGTGTTVAGRIGLRKAAPDYDVDISSTNALGLARGTVTQRPTIVSGTTPFRNNTDSTALEYGESVGVWRLLSTREYTRLVASQSPTTIGNRQIAYSNGSNLVGNPGFRWDNTEKFFQVVGTWDGSGGGQIPVIGDTSTTQRIIYGFGDMNGESVGGFMQAFGKNATVFGNPIGGKVELVADANGNNPNTFIKFSFRNSPISYIESYRINHNSGSLMHDFTGTVKFKSYGTGNKEASDLSKTPSSYVAGFATDGTVLDLEQKRDTTIYIVDTDYDFSAALTTAQVARRYNRVIFLMTTTAAAASNSELTLHTPDANLMQCEYLIRSTDEAGGFTNVIQFGSNNAVDSVNTLVSSYTPSPGQGVGIRAGLRSGVYEYFYY